MSHNNYQGAWKFYNITKGSVAPKAISNISAYCTSTGAEYIYFYSSKYQYCT
jgi:hypothetical protein